MLCYFRAEKSYVDSLSSVTAVGYNILSATGAWVDLNLSQ